MEEMQETVIEENSESCDESDSVFQSLKGKLNAIKWRNERQSGEQTICRVLKPFREENPSAYEPSIVSLGPYHHGNPSLEEMEKLKGYYLDKFLTRNPEKRLQDYIAEVRRLEKRARGAYLEELNMNSDEFVEMMVLDGSFALELMLNWDNVWSLGIRNTRQEVSAATDLLLLENQVPFFVLQALYDMNQGTKSVDSLLLLALDTVLKCAEGFFIFDPRSCTNTLRHILFKKQEVHHFLHLLYILVISTQQEGTVVLRSKRDHWKFTRFLQPVVIKNRGMMQKIHGSIFLKKLECLFGAIFSFFKITDAKSGSSDMRVVACATKLKDAGITFKRKKNPKNFFDITFENGVLEIPKICIFDNTSSYLLNVIAFEQSFATETNYMASYIEFMDCLIDTSDDVEILQEKDIIYNRLGNNDDIASFFNSACKQIFISAETSCLNGVHKSVVAYTNKRRNRWRARLKEDYFSNPWAFISFLGAVVLLVLTVIQTVFSVLSYTNPGT